MRCFQIWDRRSDPVYELTLADVEGYLRGPNHDLDLALTRVSLINIPTDKYSVLRLLNQRGIPYLPVRVWAVTPLKTLVEVAKGD